MKKGLLFIFMALIIFSNIQANPYKLMSHLSRACIFYIRPRLLKLMPDAITRHDRNAVKELLIGNPIFQKTSTNISSSSAIKFGKSVKNGMKNMLLGTYILFSSIPFKWTMGSILSYKWFKNRQNKKLIIKQERA